MDGAIAGEQIDVGAQFIAPAWGVEASHRAQFIAPLHLAGDFVDNFFIGDVTFDGGLTNEEEGGADE